MGDTNLNVLRWNLTPDRMNSYDRTQKPMSTALRERILDKGTTILNTTTPTFNKQHPDSKPSIIDLMFTTDKARIVSHQAGAPSFQ